MASVANDITQIGAQLKVKYAPKIVNLVPQNAILQQYRDPDAPGFTGNKAEAGAPVAVPISWSEAEKMGKYWVVPTKVKSGQGCGYYGTSGDLATLEDALQMELVEIRVEGSEFGTRQQVTYKALSTANSAPDKAVSAAAKLVMTDMKDVAFNRLEIAALWGQSGIGILTSQTASSTTITALLTAASFSPAIWVASIGARVQFFTVSGANWTLSHDAGTQANSWAVVTSVTTSTRTVVFTANTAWNTTVTYPAAGAYIAFGGGNGNSVTAGSPATFNEMCGLYTQLTATSGTLFNVNRASYSLLQGDTFSAGSAPLTKAKVIQAAAKLVDKGNLNDLVLLVAPSTWADLAAEDLSYRMFDSSYSSKKSESGSEELVYNNLNGKIRVVCHPFMKAGFAFLFTPGHCTWVGSSDVSFTTPGYTGENLFLQIPDKNGIEVRLYADKAIYHEAPSQGLVINNIVPAS